MALFQHRPPPGASDELLGWPRRGIHVKTGNKDRNGKSSLEIGDPSRRHTKMRAAHTKRGDCIFCLPPKKVARVFVALEPLPILR